MSKAFVKEMDAIDRRMLNILQEDFPLAERPFEAIGAKVGLTEEETRKRVKSLKDRGYIRRIGPVLDAGKLGYTSLLCGVAVPPERLEDISGAVNREAGVTHNYEREGELNLWFTVTMERKEDIERFLTTLEDAFSVTIQRFPEKRTFKIRTRFSVPED